MNVTKCSRWIFPVLCFIALIGCEGNGISICPQTEPRETWTDCVGEFSEERKWGDRNAIYYFKGEFKDGLRTGLGESRYQDGDEVLVQTDGTWSEGHLVSGFYKQNDGTVLEGVFEDTYLIDGTMTTPDGRVLKGTFYEHFLREGTLYYPDKTVSTGSWDENAIFEGKRTYPNGTIFEGKFHENDQQKEGTMYNPDNSVVTGSWDVNGNFLGGTVENSDGYKNTGIFEADGGLLEGRRIMPSGMVIEGVFENNRLKRGTFYFTNGDSLKGEFTWKNDPNIADPSIGTYLYANGDEYEGQIQNLVPHGTGKFTYADGKVETGEVRFGKRKGWDMSPSDQKFLVDLVKSTKSSISSRDNDALKKRKWISASKSLCKSPDFDAFGEKRFWVGYVDRVYMQDDGDVFVSIDINDSGNSVDNVKALDESLIDVALTLNEGTLFEKGSFVRFSGKFRRGDIGENECLDATSFTSAPEFDGEEFSFDYTYIEVVD